jgi:hypothetical protein
VTEQLTKILKMPESRIPNPESRRYEGPTPRQIQLLHVLPARLGWDDGERRGYMQLLTGKDSSKDLSRREATLVIDRLKEQVEGLPVATRRPDGATRFELAFAVKLREQLGAARFDGLARKIGRTADLGEMPGRKVRAVIEAAKSIIKRETLAPGGNRGNAECRVQSAE